MPSSPDVEAQLSISLTEAMNGTTRSIALQDVHGSGQVRKLDVKVPPGVTEGTTIRLRGQAGPRADGADDADQGDILLHIHLQPDSRFEVDGHNLITELRLSPWEAALGAKLPVQTPTQTITITVPPGSSSGQMLRLRGKGLPRRKQEHGDLLVRLHIVLPHKLTDAERKLFEQLRDQSSFNPRA